MLPLNLLLYDLFEINLTNSLSQTKHGKIFKKIGTVYEKKRHFKEFKKAATKILICKYTFAGLFAKNLTFCLGTIAFENF